MREGNSKWNSPRDCSCQLEQGLSKHLYYVLHHQRAHRWVWGSNPRSLVYIQRRNQSSPRGQGWSRARMPNVPQVVSSQRTGSDVTKWEPPLKGSSPKAVHWGEGILAEQCCMGLPPGIGADGVSQEVIWGRNCLSQEPGQVDKHLWGIHQYVPGKSHYLNPSVRKWSQQHQLVKAPPFTSYLSSATDLEGVKCRKEVCLQGERKETTLSQNQI